MSLTPWCPFIVGKYINLKQKIVAVSEINASFDVLRMSLALLCSFIVHKYENIKRENSGIFMNNNAIFAILHIAPILTLIYCWHYRYGYHVWR
jgi:hypothetical protein